LLLLVFELSAGFCFFLLFPAFSCFFLHCPHGLNFQPPAMTSG